MRCHSACPSQPIVFFRLVLVASALSVAACDSERSEPTDTPDTADTADTAAETDEDVESDEVADVPTDGDSAFDENGCRILTLSQQRIRWDPFGQVTGVTYVVEPNLDGPASDLLFVELYDSTTENLPPLTPGTFDLATAPNDNLGTCQHCLWVLVDDPEVMSMQNLYFQEAGELLLEAVTDPLEMQFAGSVPYLVMRRASLVEGQSVFEPGGDCVSVRALSFDTRAEPGKACLSAEDCNNPEIEVCQPGTNVCTAPECGGSFWCEDPSDTCVTQYGNGQFGACYAMCDPTSATSTCGTGATCVQFGVRPTSGLCKDTGSGAVGAACEVEDNTTSCVIGAVCSDVSRTCSPTCDFYAADPGCPDGSVCSLFGVCEPPSSGDPAQLGEPCDPSVELATGCADDGEAHRGLCFDYPPRPPMCEKACLSAMFELVEEDVGCAAGEFCALRFGSGLGICRPLPVCGDGALGEINEFCDDGNTTSGDGCSGDCQTVEYDVLCAERPTLALEQTFTGDTAHAHDGMAAGCGFYFSRGDLFEVAPPGPGQLRVVLTSDTYQLLSLRTDCEEVGSELGCIGGVVAAELVVQVTEAAPAPLTLLVSALTMLEEGPYAVRVEFVSEQCGDSVAVGREACDDGNTVDGDGCSGDCLLVEYDVYCAQAEPLAIGQTMSGDSEGAPDLYDSPCSGDIREPEGSDRLYSFTAPSAGTLRVVLDEDESNFTLYVLDGCGSPDQVTELDCSAVYTPDEVVVSLVAGQQVTVVADGFPQGGAYQLTAEFTPL